MKESSYQWHGVVRWLATHMPLANYFMSNARVDIKQLPLSKIVQKIVAEKSAMLIRSVRVEDTDPPIIVNRKDNNTGEIKQKLLQTIIYDAKHYEGNRTNRWVFLDLYTASALYAVYKNLNPENQKKFDCLPLGAAVGFACGIVK